MLREAPLELAHDVEAFPHDGAVVGELDRRHESRWHHLFVPRRLVLGGGGGGAKKGRRRLEMGLGRGLGRGVGRGEGGGEGGG